MNPILIDIVNDDVIEGVEYFQAHIVETSDVVRVRIGQDTVNVTINDNDSELLPCPFFWSCVEGGVVAVGCSY